VCVAYCRSRSFIKSRAIKTKPSASGKVRCVLHSPLFFSRKYEAPAVASSPTKYIWRGGAFCMEIADGARTLSARWIMSGRLLQIVMGANPRALCPTKNFKRRAGLEVSLRPCACLSFCNQSFVLCSFQNVILPPVCSASVLL
jgi:hypothetical protein